MRFQVEGFTIELRGVPDNHIIPWKLDKNKAGKALQYAMIAQDKQLSSETRRQAMQYIEAFLLACFQQLP